MEESKYSKIEVIFKKNGGVIKREDIDKVGISSWFLSSFVKRNNLVKLAPGVYASQSYFADDYYLLQRRYPKYIFSGMSALFLAGLTDKVVDEIIVSAPQGYNPSRNKTPNLKIRFISDKEIYCLGIEEVKTMFGNIVKVYDKERIICDLIKYRNKYDSETFIKAIRNYVKKSYNESKLFKYAQILHIEKQVFQVMEILINEDSHL